MPTPTVSLRPLPHSQAFSVDYDAPQAYTQSTKEHLEYTVLGKMNTAPGSYKREWKPRGGGKLFE